MKLSSDVLLFDFHGIPVLGCPATGATIGLTPKGRDLCLAMRERPVSLAEVNAVDGHLAHALRTGGFLEGDGESARALPLKSAYVHVTQRCNLACLGCYSDGEARNCAPDPSLKELTAAFSLLSAWGATGVVLSGGEPFLRDDLPLVCRAAKESGLTKVTVLSNGLAVDRDLLCATAPFADCISISFDGASAQAKAPIRGHQNFDRLCQTIQAIKQAGAQPHMIATLHRQNIDDIQAYLRLSQQLGATLNFSLLSCCDDQGALSNLVHDETSLRQLGSTIFSLGPAVAAAALDAPLSLNLTLRQRCGAASTTLSVDVDGTIYPCHMLHQKEFALGNAFNDSAISDQGQTARRFAALDAWEFDECAQCDQRRFCGGGCRARAWHAFESLEAKDPFCPMIEEFYGLFAQALTARAAQAS